MLISVATAVGADHIFGVGLELSEGGENGSPKIKSVLAGTPAATAGIKPGWTLLSVNGTNTAGRSLSECLSLVRGEEGTWARLRGVAIIMSPRWGLVQAGACGRRPNKRLEPKTSCAIISPWQAFASHGEESGYRP